MTTPDPRMKTLLRLKTPLRSYQFSIEAFGIAFTYLIVLFLPACDGREIVGDVVAIETTFPCMGTSVSLKTFSDDSEHVQKVFEDARNEIDRLVAIFTDYKQDSEVCRLTGEDRIKQWQAVSPELWELLKISDDWHRASGGAFDVSIGQLSILWREARSRDEIPSSAQIAKAKSLCGWEHVELDHTNHSVRINLTGLRLDFGSVAKGYIIEQAYQFLSANGLPSSMVRAGGDLRCGTSPPGRQGWRIEIENVDDSQHERSRYLISNAAISSSGDRYQYIEIDGKRRSHVIDPRTGIGVEGPMLVTVVAATATEADVSDTAICVMGHDAGMRLARNRPELKVRIMSMITSDDSGKIRVSQTGFDSLVPLP